MPVATGSITNILLMCGIFSSLLYAAMNVVCAMLYEGYSSASQTVSELSAIDAPTRQLWVSLAVVYSLLNIAFGLGVWRSGFIDKRLRTVGMLFIIFAIIGFFWPPMHQREVLAAGGGTLTDTLHIVFSIVAVLLMMLAIGFSAGVFGNRFKLYSISTLAIMILFGLLTALESPLMEADLPTPSMGIWERISIGAYLLWIVVLAKVILRKWANLRSIEIE